MNGKRVLITGATDGIGKQAALAIAGMGAAVTLVGRNQTKTRAVCEELQKQTGSEAIDWLLGDLSSMVEIRRVADEFRHRHNNLDVLLNNAGAIFSEYQQSADGFEMTFALNHLSYYLLTNLLLDMLRETAAAKGEARIINVSSSAHRNGTMRLDNLREASSFSMMNSYGASKLMNVLFTYEMARRLEDTDITVNAVHPGVVRTRFGHDTSRIWSALVKLFQTFALSPEKGAQTLIYLATSPDAGGISGKYWNQKQQKRSSQSSYDREQQRALWQYSAEVTGVG
ncbi:MAG: SDR family oxidoreductase [Chloroflexi bacterium]|nr:SDR family oxidoreductase [Chloroflexota bacterium]MCY3583566.1 SDR family oxidoreductase [Chloroflexota bacterium]MCY3715790.1 SDR family oxidoreductase [Chloroflexota bacterium]MDE2651021.1 SDR family oxidoreductase [Chloroflexota bacterium]MXV92462.1 SDR family oxidoreductase [Chloroflexota bacterium]